MDVDISQISQVAKTETTVPAIKTPAEESAPAKASSIVKTVKDDYTYDSTRLDYSRRSSGSGYRSMRSRGRSVWNSRSQRPRVEISRPRDYQRGSSIQKIKDVIKQIQRKYDLPKSNDISKNLKSSTQSQIASLSRQAKADGELVNPQNFIKSLEKTLPLALSTVNSGDPSFPADYSKMLAQLANELLLLINQMALLPNISPELKALLQALIQQLQMGQNGESLQTLAQQIGQLITSAGKGKIQVNQNQSLIEQLASLKLIPKKYLGAETIPVKTLEDAMAKLQGGMQRSVEQVIAMLKSSSSGNIEGKEMLLTQLTMLQGMSQGVSLNAGEQARLMQLMVGNQMLFSAGAMKGMLGAKTQQLAGKITDMIVLLAQQIGVPSNHPVVNRSGSESIFRLFSSILFGGAMMGRMIADRGDGKAWTMDDAYAGQLQAQSAKELKIFDLVPFSLFAFFSPIKRDKREEEEEKELQADRLIKELIRLMVKLAFMLTSIYTGGKKIGSGGIDYMVKQNRDQLDDVLKQLLRILMKIGDAEKVDVKSSMIFLRRGRQAMIENDQEVFWQCMFSFFTDKNDLNAFLNEVEELDSAYASIKSLLH